MRSGLNPRPVPLIQVQDRLLKGFGSVVLGLVYRDRPAVIVQAVQADGIEHKSAVCLTAILQRGTLRVEQVGRHLLQPGGDQRVQRVRVLTLGKAVTFQGAGD